MSRSLPHTPFNGRVNKQRVPARAVAAMIVEKKNMVAAWYFDGVEGDQRLPHQVGATVRAGWCATLTRWRRRRRVRRAGRAAGAERAGGGGLAGVVWRAVL
jgi:hypothetical protein